MGAIFGAVGAKLIAAAAAAAAHAAAVATVAGITSAATRFDTPGSGLGGGLRRPLQPPSQVLELGAAQRDGREARETVVLQAEHVELRERGDPPGQVLEGIRGEEELRELGEAGHARRERGEVIVGGVEHSKCAQLAHRLGQMGQPLLAHVEGADLRTAGDVERAQIIRTARAPVLATIDFAMLGAELRAELGAMICAVDARIGGGRGAESVVGVAIGVLKRGLLARRRDCRFGCCRSDAVRGGGVQCALCERDGRCGGGAVGGGCSEAGHLHGHQRRVDAPIGPTTQVEEPSACGRGLRPLGLPTPHAYEQHEQRRRAGLQAASCLPLGCRRLAAPLALGCRRLWRWHRARRDAQEGGSTQAQGFRLRQSAFSIRLARRRQQQRRLVLAAGSVRARGRRAAREEEDGCGERTHARVVVHEIERQREARALIELLPQSRGGDRGEPRIEEVVVLSNGLATRLEHRQQDQPHAAVEARSRRHRRVAATRRHAIAARPLARDASTPSSPSAVSSASTASDGGACLGSRLLLPGSGALGRGLARLGPSSGLVCERLLASHVDRLQARRHAEQRQLERLGKADACGLAGGATRQRRQHKQELRQPAPTE